MAPESADVIIGVDVCKDRLDLFEYHSERAYSISNYAAAIKTWRDSFAGRLKLALEPTNRYHLELAEAAHARGHEVHLIDPCRQSHYRAGLGRRAKTGAQDAQLLARLLKRRAALVRCKVQLNQSLTELDLLQEDAEALVKQCEQMIGKLDRASLKQAQELGWAEWIERCQAIPGVVPLTAMVLVASWCRGRFRSADAFIAFLKLDVRVKQSGAIAESLQADQERRWGSAPPAVQRRDAGATQPAAGAVLPETAGMWNEQHRRPRGPERQAGQGQLRSAPDRYPVRSLDNRNSLRRDMESIRPGYRDLCIGCGFSKVPKARHDVSGLYQRAVSHQLTNRSVALTAGIETLENINGCRSDRSHVVRKRAGPQKKAPQPLAESQRQ
jgi:hypothetical protein